MVQGQEPHLLKVTGLQKEAWKPGRASKGSPSLYGDWLYWGALELRGGWRKVTRRVWNRDLEKSQRKFWSK